MKVIIYNIYLKVKLVFFMWESKTVFEKNKKHVSVS